MGRATQLCDEPATLPPTNSRASRSAPPYERKGRQRLMTLMLGQSRFAGRNIKAGLRDGGTPDERQPDGGGSGANSLREQRHLTPLQQ
jgi:hypothetical protein